LWLGLLRGCRTTELNARDVFPERFGSLKFYESAPSNDSLQFRLSHKQARQACLVNPHLEISQLLYT
jgi:hypothetical protein